MTAIPPPPPPPVERAQPVSPVLYAIAGVIVALLATLVVVLLTRDGGSVEAGAVTTVSEVPDTIATTTAPTPESTEAPDTALFELQSGDLVVAGEFGIRVLRGTLVVAAPFDQPTQVALPTPAGDILHLSPHPDEYPDYWPSDALAGASTLWRLHPNGSDETLYSGGASMRLFEITVVPEISPGPSVVLLRSDTLDDFPFRSDSLVVVPLDGSSAHVIPEVSGFESIVTGAAWMDGFFAVSLAAEGIEAFDAYALDGSRVAWPANPEPGDTRDLGVHVSKLTRLGMTRLIAYSRSVDYPFRAPVELVIYDTATSAEIASVPILVAGFGVSMLSATDDLIVASVVEELEGVAWPYAHSTITVVDTTSFIPDGIDQIGTAAVVP